MKNRDNVIALGLLAAAVLASGCPDEIDPEPYQWPLLWDVAHAQGMFVAVGGERIDEDWNAPFQPIVYHSQDGKSWTRLPLDGSGALEAVAYGNDTFVAVGGQSIDGYDGFYETSTVMISADGQSWERIDLDAPVAFESIAFGGERFMAVARESGGIRGAVFSSADGRAWLEESLDLDGWGRPQILFAGDRFLLHTGGSQVATWRAGEGWSVTSVDVTEVRHLQVLGDEIIGIGATEVFFTSPAPKYQYHLLRYSPSTGWSKEPLDPEQAADVYEVERVGDQVLAATGRGIAVTADVTAPLPSDVVYDDIRPEALAQGNGLVVAAGTDFAWSDDGGFTWQPGAIVPAPGSAPAP